MAVIYVIAHDRNGPCKIGKAADERERLKSLQTGNPYKLRVYHTREFPDTSWAEAAAHGALQAVQLSGEWFDVTVDQAKAVVDSIAVHGDDAYAFENNPKITRLCAEISDHLPTIEFGTIRRVIHIAARICAGRHHATDAIAGEQLEREGEEIQRLEKAALRAMAKDGTLVDD